MATKPNTLFEMFTATPQLKPWQEQITIRDHRKVLDTAHHQLKLKVEAKAYEARSAFYSSLVAVHSDSKARKSAAQSVQNSAVHDMIDLLHAYMSQPLRGKVDLSERRKLIRDSGKAVGGSNVVGRWRAAEAKWLKALEA